MAHALETLERFVIEFVNLQHFRVWWMKPLLFRFWFAATMCCTSGRQKTKWRREAEGSKQKITAFCESICRFFAQYKTVNSQHGEGGEIEGDSKEKLLLSTFWCNSFSITHCENVLVSFAKYTS